MKFSNLNEEKELNLKDFCIKVIVFIIMILFLLLCNAVYVNASNWTYVIGEGFDRANSSSLGENWTEYDAGGSDSWNIELNTAEFGDSASTEDHAHYYYNLTSNITRIDYQFQLDSNENGNNLIIRLATSNASKGEVYDSSVACSTTGTYFFGCVNGSVAVVLISWSNFVPYAWYNISITGINGSHYNVTLNNTNYGRFKFNKLVNTYHHIALYGKTGAGVIYEAKLDNITLYNYTVTEEEIPEEEIPVYNETDYLHSINITLTNINENSDTITGGINMLQYIILYLGLLILGYYMIKKGDLVYGLILMFTSFSLDIYIFYNIATTFLINISDLTLDSSWQTKLLLIFGLMYTVSLALKIGGLLTIRTIRRKVFV